jgi:Fe-S-cluster containining protein
MFGCNLCSGVCCINPPLLRTFEEGMRAKSYGVEIVATPRDTGYLIAIAKKDDTCPFLKNGECSIYDDRFESCKMYECDLKNVTPAEAVIKLVFTPECLNEQPKTVKPKTLTKEQIKIIGADIITSQDELMQKLALTNPETVMELIGDVVRRVNQEEN